MLQGPDLLDVFSYSAARAIIAAENLASTRGRRAPLAVELVLEILRYGTREEAFTTAVTRAQVHVNALIEANATEMKGVSYRIDPEVLLARYAAFLESTRRLGGKANPIDCLTLLATLMVSEFLLMTPSPEAIVCVRLTDDILRAGGFRILTDDLAGVIGSVERRNAEPVVPHPDSVAGRLAAMRQRDRGRVPGASGIGAVKQAGPPARVGVEIPPYGRLLTVSTCAPFARRDEVLHPIRGRFTKGRDTLIVGAGGVGKSALARWAAALADRPAAELSVAELRAAPQLERDRQVTGVCDWLRARRGGLVLLDADAIEMVTLHIPSDIPLIVTSDGSECGVTFSPKRRLARVEMREPDIATAQMAVVAWATASGHPTVEPEAIGEAVRLADKYLRSPGTLPGSAIDLIRRAQTGKGSVDVSRLCKAVVEITGLPEAIVNDKARLHLNSLEERLGSRLIGQRAAVGAVASAIRRRSVALGDTKRPAGVFLFVGPTGVGKTELARVLATEVFGSEKALVRFDSAEYQHDHEIAKLIGSPPGYVGSNAPGQLILALTKTPACVLLFDEIEKAHPALYDLLLGAFDYGVITGNKGEKVSLEKAIVILTSNLGGRAEDELRSPLGFGASTAAAASRAGDLVEIRDNAVKKYFRPEFLNRLTGIVHFEHLTRADMTEILDLRIALLAAQLKRYRISVTLGARMRESLVDRACADFGAGRALVRLFESEVEGRLTGAWLAGDYAAGSQYEIDLDEDGSPRTLRALPA